MKEGELYYAYRSLTRGEEKPIIDPNWVRCAYGSCPVTIALWANRIYCRYHERKLRDRK